MVEESSKARGIPLACRVVSAIATFPSFSGSQQRFGDRPNFRLLFRKPRSVNLRYLHLNSRITECVSDAKFVKGTLKLIFAARRRRK